MNQVHKQLEDEWLAAMSHVDHLPMSVVLQASRPNFVTYHERPLLAFAKIVKEGLLPPPELMLWVCARYDEYLAADGAKNIEELFFDKVLPSKGGGSFAYRNYRDQEIIYCIERLEGHYFEHPEVTSLRVAISMIFNKYSDDKINSLLRRLRRLGLKQANWIATLDPHANSDY